MRTITSAVMLALLTTSCMAQHPMGLTREQWEATPPARQAIFQAQQYEIDEQRRQQAAAARLERERIAAEQMRAEQEHLRQAYANARYGDVVQVTVTGGFIAYGSKHYPAEPVAFELTKGERKRVDFAGGGSQRLVTRYSVRLSEDGNTITFDDSDRQRIILVNQNWDHGQTYRPGSTQNDVGVRLTGATFFVKLKPLQGGPTRIIIENR